eukprot:jgi/Botrbrau1/11403/Bobra.0151s0030.1
MNFETEKLTFRQKRILKSSKRRVLVDSIEIGLASPEQIREWSRRILPNKVLSGEVLTPKTVDYKTLKPIKDGLFCEKIFGPTRDFICSCGKKRTNKSFCPECSVEHTEARVRRYRLGHINLISPVTHVWYLRGRPSYIATLLGKKRRSIEALAYCTTFLPECIPPSGKKNSQAHDDETKSSQSAFYLDSKSKYKKIRSNFGELSQGKEIVFQARSGQRPETYLNPLLTVSNLQQRESRNALLEKKNFSTQIKISSNLDGGLATGKKTKEIEKLRNEKKIKQNSLIENSASINRILYGKTLLFGEQGFQTIFSMKKGKNWNLLKKKSKKTFLDKSVVISKQFYFLFSSGKKLFSEIYFRDKMEQNLKMKRSFQGSRIFSLNPVSYNIKKKSFQASSAKVEVDEMALKKRWDMAIGARSSQKNRKETGFLRGGIKKRLISIHESSEKISKNFPQRFEKRGSQAFPFPAVPFLPSFEKGLEGLSSKPGPTGRNEGQPGGSQYPNREYLISTLLEKGLDGLFQLGWKRDSQVFPALMEEEPVDSQTFPFPAVPAVPALLEKEKEQLEGRTGRRRRFQEERVERVGSVFGEQIGTSWSEELGGEETKVNESRRKDSSFQQI